MSGKAQRTNGELGMTNTIRWIYGEVLKNALCCTSGLALIKLAILNEMSSDGYCLKPVSLWQVIILTSSINRDYEGRISITKYY